MRLVLDSNVWIDWLVFDDPAVAPLKAACRDARVEIAIDPPCLDELAAVLAYPEFGLDAGQQAAAAVQVRRIAVTHARSSVTAGAMLPRCADPDDQKFIDLAHAARADWLVTRDKALLRLDGRLRRAGPRVGTPAQWAAAAADAG
ncbi:MAG TPA: putative toxin-antitoxin system toxin component, PIN family [Burkholderiales bacterium]|nr:putative toxin-antitoxin system toxin component, PIN family [Burkholderiales bacterium]